MTVQVGKLYVCKLTSAKLPAPVRVYRKVTVRHANGRTQTGYKVRHAVNLVFHYVWSDKRFLQEVA